jgi:hypothetical protein
MTSRDAPQNEARVAGALAALRAAFDNATTTVRETPDPHDAFRHATALADVLREIAEDAAELRASTVAQIREAEQLSLAGLAQRIGVSKARADQLLKSGDRRRREKVATSQMDEAQANPLEGGEENG